jgi:hypothetical protein
MEQGPGPADPVLSQIKTGGSAWTGSGYTKAGGTGYNPIRGGTGKVGTINAGVSTPVTPGPPPAQLRFYRGTDGNLYALDNQTGQAYVVGPALNAPQPPVYSPTK